MEPKKSGVVITPEDIKGVAFTGSDYVPDSSVIQSQGEIVAGGDALESLAGIDPSWLAFVGNRVDTARQMIAAAGPAALSPATREQLVKCLTAVGDQAIADAGSAQGAKAEVIDAISALVNVISRPSPPPDLLSSMIQYVEKTIATPEIGGPFRAAVEDLIAAAKGDGG